MGALDLCGKDMTVGQIMDIVIKDAAFYGSNGGITLSGGEPLMQAHGAISLLTAAKERGITTAVETCGYFDSNIIESLIGVTDTFLFDLKDTNEERHIKTYRSFKRAHTQKSI